MAPEIQCTVCGEREKLTGARTGELIHITCDACGHEWDRDPRGRCPGCGNTDLRAAPKAVVQKVRGNQISIVGTVTVHLCPDCDRDALDTHMRSGAPVPPDEPPAGERGS